MKMIKSTLTLGSLFDGSGGFPLGGLLCGIEPKWASEVEPFAVRVTTKRLPQVKHLGDVSKIQGGNIEPVDVITFGSPCQDMSIAGKRAGLDGSRSNLFYEAIRIVKEMRCATNEKYPRYIVWENVPGAFSSNQGEDFRAVLEAVCTVKGRFPIPRPEKWSGAGEILGDGFSVAWRTLDAQYWGVPQRRRRIYLVADFDGECAGKILFESESVSGYPSKGFFPWQEVAGAFAESVGATGGAICLNDQGGQRMDITEGMTNTLRAESHHPPCVMESAETFPALFENHSQDSRYTGPLDVAQTVSATYGMGGNNQPFVVSVQGSLIGRTEKNGPQGTGVNEDVSFTLNTVDRHAVAYGIDRAAFNQGENAKYSFAVDEERQPTMVAKGPGAVAQPTYCMTTGGFAKIAKEKTPALLARDYKAPPVVNNTEYIVRRLMPTECARLQGFPDWWCSSLGTDDPTKEELDWWAVVFETQRRIAGKSTRPKSRSQIAKWLKNPYSDAAEYRLWGNGVALPNVCFVLAGIVWYAQNHQV